MQAKEIGKCHTLLNKFLLYLGLAFFFGAGLDNELCRLCYKTTILNPNGSSYMKGYKSYCQGAILEVREFTIVLLRGYFGFYHILSSRGATLDKKLSGYKKRAVLCV